MVYRNNYEIDIGDGYPFTNELVRGRTWYKKQPGKKDKKEHDKRRKGKMTKYELEDVDVLSSVKVLKLSAYLKGRMKNKSRIYIRRDKTKHG